MSGAGRALWLVRHAKTAPDPPAGGADRDRRLVARGRQDADALGRRLGPRGDHLGLPSDAGGGLGLVLCSTAARALETAERLLAAWPEDERPPLVPRPDLYGASPDQVLDVVRGMPDETASVMVVGHNPTMMALAALLATGGADSPFPTAGVAVYRFGLDRWEDVGQGTASELGRFAPPY